MRLMNRNTRTFWYALYDREQPIIDGDGFDTGEKKSIYSAPVMVKGNISAARGDAYSEQFGMNLAYSRVIALDDIDTPITETTRLWIDNLDITKPFDYVVVRVAKSLNSVLIAVKKVDVSE